MKAWTLLLIDDQGMTTEVTSSFVSPAECVHAGSAWQATMAVKGTKSMCIERSTSVKDTVAVAEKPTRHVTDNAVVAVLVGGFMLGVIAHRVYTKVME